MTSATGPALFAPERHELILRELRASGRVEQARLARDLRVSGETIRKDLAALEEHGLLQRVHGGAVRAASLTAEPPVTTRIGRRAEKVAIARAALRHLPETGAILIDAGSTTSALAELLPDDRRLTVYTTAMAVALSLLDRPGLDVRALGGRLRAPTLAAVGSDTVDQLARINVEVAFLGTNGISEQRGLTTPDPAEAAVKTAMLDAAGRRILLADSSKFGLISQCRHARFDDIDVLVTDSGIAAVELKSLTDAGVEVEVVHP